MDKVIIITGGAGGIGIGYLPRLGSRWIEGSRRRLC